MAYGTASCSAYTRVGVETASQGKLVIMLFDGAIQRAELAVDDIAARRFADAHKRLIRAQEIISELRASLNHEVTIARNLDRVYEYFLHLLVQGNVRKDPEPIRTAIQLMADMRDTWREAFARVEQERPATAPPPELNRHGHSCMNLEG